MNMDKKTILAFLMIGLVFLLVQSPLYQKIFFPQSYQKQLERKENKALPADSTHITSDKPDQSAALDTRLSAAEPGEPLAAAEPPAQPAREIVVDSKLYRAVFSSRGGTLVSWTLKNYKKVDGSLVTMLPAGSTGSFGIDFVNRDDELVHTDSWSFESDAPAEILLSGGSQTLTFQYRLDAERFIRKSYTLTDGRYDMQLEIVLNNLGAQIGDKSYQVVAPDGLASTEKRLEEDVFYAKAVISAAGRVNKFDKAKGVPQKESGSIDWVAVRTKYFTSAIIPLDRKAEYATVLGQELVLPEYTKGKWKKFGIGLGMPFTRDSARDLYTIYMGPMQDDLLKSYGAGLENLMDMGAKIIQPFSIATLWTFKKIHSVVPNYGVVLIIFALLIKIITAPLTHKSNKSMKKMQALQPRLEELKEKYGKDAQRLNTETMKLYKEAGVNPMGGCLPILLQMPLLWALYIVFRGTISLRHEGFFGWIKDLSGPDTIFTLPFSIPMFGDGINVLPILMGLTMLLQQKMTITDPKQKAMIYIMPVFMTLLFNNFPSGLNLYYTLFNVFSIVHQKYFMGDAGVLPAFTKKR